MLSRKCHSHLNSLRPKISSLVILLSEFSIPAGLSETSQWDDRIYPHYFYLWLNCHLPVCLMASSLVLAFILLDLLLPQKHLQNLFLRGSEQVIPKETGTSPQRPAWLGVIRIVMLILSVSHISEAVEHFLKVFSLIIPTSLRESWTA